MKLAWVAIAGLALASYANAGTYTTTTSSGGVIVPGTTDIGNHCDDCTRFLTLPFDYSFFGTLFSSGNSIIASSNGVLEFTGNTSSFSSTSLPSGSFGAAIFGMWDDLRTDNGQGACTGTCGIFTSTTGVVGSRILNIEWVTNFFSSTGSKATFEIQLFEGLRSSISFMEALPVWEPLGRLEFRTIPEATLRNSRSIVGF